MKDIHSIRRKRPPWLKVKAFGGEKYLKVRSELRGLKLHTVCEEANCPNRGECFSSGTATFLLLGPACTRNCRFCNVLGGSPQPVDPQEPDRVAEMARRLKLRHVVVTSVTRDDLPDQGAGQFALTIRKIRRTLPEASIEVLTPDFGGREELLSIVLSERPDVFNHNVETVPELYGAVRPQADYRRSLEVLKSVARFPGESIVKSGLMVGLGESVDQLEAVFADLATVGTEVLTIGQYLAPSKAHHPIDRYYHPQEFAALAQTARRSGIPTVVAAPLVRSSYKAGNLLHT
jgi:lipoic acid synthetase